MGIKSEIRNTQRGFTLIELIVVLVLVVLITGLVSPSIIRNLSSSKVRYAGKNLLTALRYTRAQAIAKRQQQVLELDLENKTYTIPIKNKTITLPEELELKLLTAQSELDGDSKGTIRFFPDGSSTGGKVTLLTEDREWQIAVAWLTGEATLTYQQE